MFAYFILILTLKISEAKAVLAPLDKDGTLFVGASDLKDLKILGLTLAVLGLGSLGRALFSFFSNDNRTVKEKVNELERSSDLILAELKQINISMAQLRDSQINESGIRHLVRDEMSYSEKLKRRD